MAAGKAHVLAGESFPTQKAILARLREIRERWSVDTPITGADDAFLRALRPDVAADHYMVTWFEDNEWKRHKTQVAVVNGQKTLVGMNKVAGGNTPRPDWSATEAAKRYANMGNIGIPTNYSGVHFRSRLEAKWAAFFDLMGWRWEYEPFDMRGVIPDFSLQGLGKSTLVEVKPISTINEAREVLLKYERAGALNQGREVLVLGHSWPAPSGYYVERLPFGWLGETKNGVSGVPYDSAYDDEVERANHEHYIVSAATLTHSQARWGGTRALTKKLPAPAFGFICSGDWVDRITDHYQGGTTDSIYRDGWSSRFYDEALAKWREAGNKVQWHPR